MMEVNSLTLECYTVIYRYIKLICSSQTVWSTGQSNGTASVWR